jgi:ribosomal protein S18 acetylase RimI-like enzyme
MAIILRPAQKSDMGAVLGLIKELAAFEKEADAVEVTENDLIRDGFGEENRFKVFLAEEDGEVLGMALIYDRYSTWKGRVIHLEDLIVRRKDRNRGIGGALYREVMKYAFEQGVKRVCWEVLDWNEVAIDFYHSTGARIVDGWLVVHMDEHSLKQYVTEAEA